jgi:hypothetical protein
MNVSVADPWRSGRSTGSGTQRSRVVGIIAAIGLLGVGPACGIVKRNCTDTNIDVRVARGGTVTAPMILTATLTTDDEPVADAPVSFFVSADGDGDDVSERVGRVTTDASGVARLELRRGVEGALPPGVLPTRVRARFASLTSVNGQTYCFSDATVPL